MRKYLNWRDELTERVIGRLLRAGVLFSASIVLMGAILYLFKSGGAIADLAVFKGEPSELSNIHGIVRGAYSLESRAVIQLGVLLLIATPVARVAFSIWAFAVERDWIYVVITALVLMILLRSLLGSA